MTDPVGDVVGFIRRFEKMYGSEHPMFYYGTYSQVSAIANNRNDRKSPHESLVCFSCVVRKYSLMMMQENTTQYL